MVSLSNQLVELENKLFQYQSKDVVKKTQEKRNQDGNNNHHHGKNNRLPLRRPRNMFEFLARIFDVIY
jgi:hypothetical protein